MNLNNLADGAANMTMNWNLFDPTTGNGQLTDYSQASGLASSTQDGTTASSLTSVGIQDGGQVVATYSNGKTKVEAQLAMAEVQNPTSLQNVGNNNFSIGANTSTPAIGGPKRRPRPDSGWRCGEFERRYGNPIHQPDRVSKRLSGEFARDLNGAND